jgi:hypothetical protein
MIFWQIFKTQVESNASQPEQPVSETVEGTEELPEPVQAEQMAVEVDSKVLQITEQKVKKKPFIDKQKVPEEASAPFAGMKLKKSTPVQRKPVEHKLESVQLKHHEFEAKPQVEEVTTTVNKHVTKTLTFQPY